MEFLSFGEGQPQSLLKFLIQNLVQIPQDKLQEIGDIAEQVSLPQELVDIATEKFNGIPQYAGYIQNLKQFLYDQSAGASVPVKRDFHAISVDRTIHGYRMSHRVF